MRPATALVLVLLALPAAGAWGVTWTEPAPCAVYVHGVGEACPVEGGYEVELADGRRVFTHGPDPVPSGDLVAMGYAPFRDPVCVEDPLQEFHAHLIYTYPVNQPDRSIDLIPELRRIARHANGLLYAEGVETGAGVDYRFACDADGAPVVSVAPLPLVTGEGDYRVIVNFLTAQGFVNPHAKYWVFHDDRSACTCGGIAAAPLSSDPSPFNPANGGAMFGVNYGYTGDFGTLVSMHENGHNLGAVRNGVPDSSGAGHCNDGQDIMCYADGGPTANYRHNVCGLMHFDCDHDSYFHTRPVAGSLLATTWNLGSPMNRYLQGCFYVDEALLAPRASPANVVSLDVPSSCGGRPFGLYGRPLEHPVPSGLSGPSLNSFVLCWFEGATQRACHSDVRGWQSGAVPQGVDRAEVRWINGDNGRFTLSIV